MAHGAKGTTFGGAEGCEYGADISFAEKDNFVEDFLKRVRVSGKSVLSDKKTAQGNPAKVMWVFSQWLATRRMFFLRVEVNPG